MLVQCAEWERGCSGAKRSGQEVGGDVSNSRVGGATAFIKHACFQGNIFGAKAFFYNHSVFVSLLYRAGVAAKKAARNEA